MDIKYLIAAANISLITIMVGLYVILDFGGVGFSLGFCSAILLSQSVYRIKHGEWFDGL